MSGASSKKKFYIDPNVGEDFTIEGTRVDFDALTNRITVYDGDSIVASVAGGSFHVVS